MNRVGACQIVVGVWNGRQQDDRLVIALHVLGIKPETFNLMMLEAKKVCRAFPGNLILTPTSAGRRR